ncbi:MAG: MlaC/ttg2D family ABC transporter substrate-binding protein [Geminicoccaceae bacterium]
MGPRGTIRLEPRHIAPDCAVARATVMPGKPTGGEKVMREWSAWTGRGPVLKLVIFLVLIAIPINPVAADDAIAAEGVVRALANEVWTNVDQEAGPERKERLARAITKRTNVDALSRLALGRYWQRLDEAQRAEYQQLFATVVIGDLADRLDAYLGSLSGSLDQHFKITASMSAGKRDVLVRSKVMPDRGQPISVDWRLRRFDTDPVILDLVIEGVSLLVSQRAEFAAVIERSRIEGLITGLRNRI